jgi:hypothetical protein
LEKFSIFVQTLTTSLRKLKAEDGSMKRVVQMALLLLLISSFLGHTVLAQETRGPRIVVKEPVFDFKEIKEGSVVQHTFKVFNEGDETLEIKSVRPG